VYDWIFHSSQVLQSILAFNPPSSYHIRYALVSLIIGSHNRVSQTGFACEGGFVHCIGSNFTDKGKGAFIYFCCTSLTYQFPCGSALRCQNLHLVALRTQLFTLIIRCRFTGKSCSLHAHVDHMDDSPPVALGFLLFLQLIAKR